MKDITVSSLEDFLSHFNTFMEIDFFRGHSSVDYQLIPSIGRYYSEGNEDSLRQFEKDIFEDFKRKYSLFTDVRPGNDKEFLFLAQHYGLPTRLLDWTYNPLIALYFACASNKNRNGVVYHCYPFSHHIFDEKKHDILSFEYLDILVPTLTDVRYKNQSGLFTLHPNPWKDEISEHLKARYFIPANVKTRILNKLEKIGMTRSFIFPSLDSLAKDVLDLHKKRYPSLTK